MVKGSETRAQEMVEKALHTLSDFKQEQVDSASKQVETEKKNFDMKVHELTSKRTKSRNHLREEHKENPIPEILLDDETWVHAGYTDFEANNRTSISSSLAVDFIKSLPLKKYSLRHDSKRDFLVNQVSSRDEMRTRTHLGVIDTDFAAEFIDSSLYRDGKLEPSLLNFVNLKALVGIADEVDFLRITLDALNFSTMNTSKLSMSIRHLHDHIDSLDKFESVSDLTAQLAAVEAELATKKITLQLKNVKHALRIQRDDIRIDKMVSIMDAESQSHYLEIYEKNLQISARQKESHQKDTLMSSTIEAMNLINELSISANKTKR